MEMESRHIPGEALQPEPASTPKTEGLLKRVRRRLSNPGVREITPPEGRRISPVTEETEPKASKQKYLVIGGEGFHVPEGTDEVDFANYILHKDRGDMTEEEYVDGFLAIQALNKQKKKLGNTKNMLN